ncbi:MAG: sugar transporter, partial [Pseudomonadales bacterium]
MNNPSTMLEFEEEGKSLRDYVNILRRRKRKIAITAAAVMTLVLLVTFLWPATYRSESVILIEQQDIPSELVRTTITSYAQQRIEEIKQRIMTISNIMGIVEKFELYSERELRRKTRTEIAQDFRKAVSIRPISAEVV